MDENEFRRLLERYPVVRKKTHCRVQWNDMGSCSLRDQVTQFLINLYHWQYDEETERTSSGIFISTGRDCDIKPLDSVEDALEKFLAPYFSSQETAKIQQQLEKTQKNFVSSLCLEDVNDLCEQFVTTK